MNTRFTHSTLKILIVAFILTAALPARALAASVSQPEAGSGTRVALEELLDALNGEKGKDTGKDFMIDRLIDAIDALDGEQEASPDISFTDVRETDWYYPYVMTCAKKGLFSGVGSGMFAPNKNMSRVEFLTVVIRYLYPNAEKNYEGDRSPWWTPYYQIALEKGLLLETEFAAGDMETAMTRQEMALIIARALEKMGRLPQDIVDESQISDYATIDPYYQEAVKITYSAGIITGRDSTGTFAPKETLTRGQGSTVICRMPMMETGTKQPTEQKPVNPDGTVTLSGSWYRDEIGGWDHRFDEGALHQEWVEGEPHGEPHVGDVIIKADGTRVTLEATIIGGSLIMGWGADGPQGVDPYTGTAFENGTVTDHSQAWWGAGGVLRKDPVTGCVFSTPEWKQINSHMKPDYDGKTDGERGGPGDWFEWDGWLQTWLWAGPLI